MRKGELTRRLEALEQSGNQSVEAWIGPPESGLSGWECLPQNGSESETVWRLPGESDDDLRSRSRSCMAKLRRQADGGACVFFGVNADGLSR
jgi:broad specificity phosphatase PhoE